MKNCLPLCLLITVSLLGCRQDSVSSTEELTTYISDPENNLTQTHESNGYKMTLTYRPTDLIVSQEISETPTQSEIDNALKKYNDYYYFVLSLSYGDHEALNPADPQFSDVLQTLSFRMRDYVTMTTAAGDTIPVGDFMLNRTYGLASSTDVLFAFSNAKAAEKEWIQFNLNEFGIGTGNQRFRFKLKDIRRIPRLKFQASSRQI